MPGIVPPVADEREALLAFLRQQRLLLTTTAFGLDDEQARATPSASSLSVGGILKHVATVESYWIDIALQHPLSHDDRDYERNFRLDTTETLLGVLRRYAEVAERTEAAIAGIADLGQAVPVPKDVPWFPADVEAWSVRWVLLHLIEETARHVGHAEIVRESIDGATAFPLMAAAEGWPETPWVKPWVRPARPA